MEVECNEPRTSAKISRVSKACEPCRARRTRCDISNRLVCSECEKRDSAGDCVVRQKARPKRPHPPLDHTNEPPPSKTARIDDLPASVALYQQMPSGSSNAGSPVEDRILVPIHTEHHPDQSILQVNTYASTSNKKTHPSAIAQVEQTVREMAMNKLDLDIDLAIHPERVFPASSYSNAMSLQELGLSPGDASSSAKSRHWINMHFGDIHHNTPFLHLPQIYQISDRFFGGSRAEAKVINSDELALLYSILALGAFREETWDSSKGNYRARRLVDAPSHSPRYNGNTGDARAPGASSLSLFQLASDEIDNLELPSESAVQALFLMHNFISNTIMGRRSRDFVARAVMMSHEIGLNRRIPLDMAFGSLDGALSSSHLKRRAILYLYVYFSDVYLAALDNQPPLIKSTDFEQSVFDPIIIPSSESGTVTPAGASVSGLTSFVDVIRVTGLVLEELHGSMALRPEADIENILRLESLLDALRSRLSSKTFGLQLDVGSPVNQAERARVAGRLLRQIHYNWCRIALRATYLRHPLLGHSSLAVCVRAASSILSHYRRVCAAGLLNLPWMQLRRIATCIQLIFLGFWQGELLNQEAEESIDHALMLTNILSTRWAGSRKLSDNIIKMAKASGLRFREEMIIVSPASERVPAQNFSSLLNAWQLPPLPLPAAGSTRSAQVPEPTPFDPCSLWATSLQLPRNVDPLASDMSLNMNTAWYPPPMMNNGQSSMPSNGSNLQITDNNGLVVTDWDDWFQSLV